MYEEVDCSNIPKEFYCYSPRLDEIIEFNDITPGMEIRLSGMPSSDFRFFYAKNAEKKLIILVILNTVTGEHYYHGDELISAYYDDDFFTPFENNLKLFTNKTDVIVYRALKIKKNKYGRQKAQH